MTETPGPSFRMRPGGLYLKASWALVVIGVLEAITGLAQLALRATTQDPDRVLLALNLAFVITGLALAGAGQIGRASCRERVSSSVWGGDSKTTRLVHNARAYT